MSFGKKLLVGAALAVAVLFGTSEDARSQFGATLKWGVAELGANNKASVLSPGDATQPAGLNSANHKGAVYTDTTTGTIYKWDGSAWRKLAAGGALNEDIFTENGTWVRPEGIDTVWVSGCGGGSGGGYKTSLNSGNSPRGGTGGDCGWNHRVAVTGNVTITIGSGGAGRTTENLIPNPGGNTSFGNLVTFTGGNHVTPFVDCVTTTPGRVLVNEGQAPTVIGTLVEGAVGAGSSGPGRDCGDYEGGSGPFNFACGAGRGAGGGGASLLADGGDGALRANEVPTDGGLPGGGGGACCRRYSTSCSAGGDGGDGQLIVRWRG